MDRNSTNTFQITKPSSRKINKVWQFMQAAYDKNTEYAETFFKLKQKIKIRMGQVYTYIWAYIVLKDANKRNSNHSS